MTEMTNTLLPGAEPVPIEEEDPTVSENFSSRWAFWLTIIGCSVGFGNVWRFPYLCYTYGGLSFLLIYLIGLTVVVWPLTLFEMGIAQVTQSGHMKACASLGKWCKAIGMVGLVAFNVCCYYPLLLTWSLRYLMECFHQTTRWSISSRDAATCEKFINVHSCQATKGCDWNPATNKCIVDVFSAARTFFHDNCFAHNSFAENDHYEGIQSISTTNVLMMFISWTLNCLGLTMGKKLIGYIMYITMTMPSIFLVALVIIGATLKGSGLGIREYILKFDVEKFISSNAWSGAIAQGIFSVGVAQGTMAALSAHNKKDQNFVVDGIVVIIADTLYAFLAGCSVFSVIGYLLDYTGKTYESIPLDGIALAFTTYPVGLSILPGVLANIAEALFFMTLWLLGMDTLIGLTESLVLMICESRLTKKYGIARWHVTLAISIFFFLLPGMLCCTNMGYSFLDSLDNYSCNVAQMFGAGVEALGIGWIYLSGFSMEVIGKVAYLTHCISFFTGVGVIGIFQNLNPTVAFASGFSIMILGACAAFFLCKDYDSNLNYLTWKRKIHYLTTFSVEPMLAEFNEALGPLNRIKVPYFWTVLVKYFTTGMVFYLLTSSLASPAIMYQRPKGYLPYPWYVFLFGQFGPFILVIGSTLFFFIFPDLMDPLLPEKPTQIVFGERRLKGANAHLLSKQVESCENLEAALPKDA